MHFTLLLTGGTEHYTRVETVGAARLKKVFRASGGKQCCSVPGIDPRRSWNVCAGMDGCIDARPCKGGGGQEGESSLLNGSLLEQAIVRLCTLQCRMQEATIKADSLTSPMSC